MAQIRGIAFQDGMISFEDKKGKVRTTKYTN